jgi:hypothetical protein
MLQLEDLTAKSALTLTEAATVIGAHTGRRPSSSTLWRWSLRGVRGKRLEVIRVGGTLYTTRASVVEFLNDYPSAPPERRDPPGRPAKQTVASQVAAEQRGRERAAAKEHLDRVCSPRRRTAR